MIDDLKGQGIDWFEISATTKNWHITIERLFSDKRIKYEYQQVYKHGNKLLITSNHEGYKIKKLNSDFFKSGIKNTDCVSGPINQFWGSLERLFENGVCYYAVKVNTAVSICYSGFLLMVLRL